MLHRLPKAMPPLGVMVRDIGNPHPRDLARALGVSPRTVYHWLARDTAPRPVLLSLFWVTRWGQQWLDADLFNEARLQRGLASSLARQMDLDHAQATQEAKTAPRGRSMLFLVRSSTGHP